ncbi:hypothetical protein PBY51_014865 [Eleginops maclovinus]|uniref:Uncharacterized protein n=1 Tax=Eleginops maclovinus TaxID=56733 RepID=A0AAN7X499_ELEMC|nr:hypothetical protein PBY51_014865 [Eleginops maclovinus]
MSGLSSDFSEKDISSSSSMILGNIQVSSGWLMVHPPKQNTGPMARSASPLNPQLPWPVAFISPVRTSDCTSRAETRRMKHF